DLEAGLFQQKDTKADAESAEEAESHRNAGCRYKKAVELSARSCAGQATEFRETSKNDCTGNRRNGLRQLPCDAEPTCDHGPVHDVHQRYHRSKTDVFGEARKGEAPLAREHLGTPVDLGGVGAWAQRVDDKHSPREEKKDSPGQSARQGDADGPELQPE